MAKCPVMLVALLATSALLVGCSPTEPEPAEPERVQTPQAQIKTAEPAEVEPAEQETTPAEPNQVEISETEAEVAEPNAVEPNQAGPVESEPVDEEPAPAEPNQVEIGQTEAGVADANAVEPNEVEQPRTAPPEEQSSTTDPNVPEPLQTVPGQIEPNDLVPTAPVEVAEAEPNKPEPNEVKVDATTGPAKVTFHEKCSDILTTFVDKEGLVNYNDLRRKRLELKRLLDAFDELERSEYNSWPRQDRAALWINAFNVKMLDIILRNYPIESTRWHRLMWPPTSIRHIPPTGTIGIEKWNDYKLLVMDEEFTLAAIEKRFFRTEFRDPRVLLALTHASLSSPPLRNEPYYGDRLNEQLDDQVKRFLSSSHAFRIDRAGRRVYLSAVLESSWYGSEFVAEYGIDRKFKDHPPATRAVLNFLTNYISDEDANFLEVETYSLGYMNYDWRLNDSSGPR
ncbi:MAG: DUF547 domain-containing protein [Phycisphaerales bacterium]|nr:MAG: DUF547 domain-containing protein [Phycisphaerales bacterium]